MSDSNQPKGFGSAKKQAEDLLKDGKKLKNLLERGVEKANDQKNALSGFWEDVQAIIRFIKAYISGSYRQVATKTILFAIAGIVYFVNPFDVLPDFLLGMGFIDDATVIGFVLKHIKTELDKFTLWEKKNIEIESSPD